MTIIAQINVLNTNNMSIEASRLFCNPNCIGENRKLNKRFNKNGKSIVNGIVFLKYINKTFPKEIAIKMYKNVQTGPKTQEGGDHVGLIMFEYQLSSSIGIIIHYVYYLAF